MPGGLPLGLDVCNAQLYSVGMVATATANTKTAYSQVTASTTSDAVWLIVQTNFYPRNTTTSVAIDIAVGGAGSELVIISNLVMSDGNVAASDYPCYNHSFPCQIPAGTRIAARYQASAQPMNASDVAVYVYTLDGSFTQMEGTGGVDAMGFTAATTLGTTVDTGATPGTKGAYAQLTASTARDYMGFFLAFDEQNDSGASEFNVFVIDIAIGGAGSETIIMPNIQASKAGGQKPIVWDGYFPFVPISIPAGTRLAARASCNVAGSPGRLIGVTLYGVYQ